jgi:hypothetical protein
VDICTLVYIFIHVYVCLWVYIYIYIYICIYIGSINNTKASWSSSSIINRPKDKYENDSNKVYMNVFVCIYMNFCVYLHVVCIYVYLHPSFLILLYHYEKTQRYLFTQGKDYVCLYACLNIRQSSKYMYIYVYGYIYLYKIYVCMYISIHLIWIHMHIWYTG